jgi:hypothetical protein
MADPDQINPRMSGKVSTHHEYLNDCMDITVYGLCSRLFSPRIFVLLPSRGILGLLKGRDSLRRENATYRGQVRCKNVPGYYTL